MRIYYDPETGVPSFTFNGPDEIAPVGGFIEGALEGPLASYQVIDGELVEVDMEPRRELARIGVYTILSQARKSFITDLPGQGMIYLDKELEAKRYLALDPEPEDLTDFPWISHEIGITGQTAYQVAYLFEYKASLWRYVGPIIEALRLEAGNVIDAAQSQADIDAALLHLQTELDKLQ
jgi:hypothetical protein